MEYLPSCLRIPCLDKSLFHSIPFLDFILLNFSMILLLSTQNDFYQTAQAKIFLLSYFIICFCLSLGMRFLPQVQHYISPIKAICPLIMTIAYFEIFGIQQKGNYLLLNLILFNILAINDAQWYFSLEIPFLGLYYMLRNLQSENFEIFSLGGFYLGLIFSFTSYKKQVIEEKKLQLDLDENSESQAYKKMLFEEFSGKIIQFEAKITEVPKRKKWKFERLIRSFKKKKEGNVKDDAKQQKCSENDKKKKLIAIEFKAGNDIAKEAFGDFANNQKKFEDFLKELNSDLEHGDLEQQKPLSFNDFIIKYQNSNIRKSSCYQFYHPEFRETLKLIPLKNSFFFISLPPVSSALLRKRENEELKKINEMKDRILAAVSHDMRSPLGGIIYYIKSAKETENPIIRQQKLDFALVNTNLLLYLVNDFLDFSLFANNKSLKANSTKFALSGILEEVLSLLKIEAQNKGISLILQNECRANLLLFSDERRLKQVLLNLLTNAIKFTFQGFVKLKVSQVSDSDNLIRFEVIDTGLGIKQENRPDLMKPFATFDNPNKKANKNGIGLGLFICKTLVGILGPEANLFIHSEEGIGTKVGFVAYIMNGAANESEMIVTFRSYKGVFEKTLETYQEENAIESDMRDFDIKSRNISSKAFYNKILTGNTTYSRKSTVKTIIRLSTIHSDRSFIRENKIVIHTLRTYCILIVDDQAFNLMILEEILNEFKEKNLRVESATNGNVAVEMFMRRNSPGSDEEPYDLIFMDKEMPLMNGIEATNIIRTKIYKEGYKDVRIVGCTGDSCVDRNKHEFSGLDECFMKPITSELVNYCLKKFLM